jgi:hypothetical protein
MMPRVRLHRGARHIFAQANDGAKQEFLHDDHDDQNNQREWRGAVMRGKNLAHTLNREGDRCDDDACRDDARCHRLGFAVAIRMSRVRRPRGKFESAPYDSGAGDVERRFDPIRDQDVSVAEQTRGDFRHGENEIHQHAGQRHARAGLHIAGGIVRCRMKSLRHYEQNF